MLDDSTIFLVTQKDLRVDSRKIRSYTMEHAKKQMLKLPNGTLRILVKGKSCGNYCHKEAEKCPTADRSI